MIAGASKTTLLCAAGFLVLRSEEAPVFSEPGPPQAQGGFGWFLTKSKQMASDAYDIACKLFGPDAVALLTVEQKIANSLTTATNSCDG